MRVRQAPKGLAGRFVADSTGAVAGGTDGQTEEITWKNGEEFADYVRPYEVPGSHSAGDLLDAGQVRWFAIVPKRRVEIRKIILESFNNQVAPTFIAMTAQVE